MTRLAWHTRLRMRVLAWRCERNAAHGGPLAEHLKIAAARLREAARR